MPAARPAGQRAAFSNRDAHVQAACSRMHAGPLLCMLSPDAVASAPRLPGLQGSLADPVPMCLHAPLCSFSARPPPGGRKSRCYRSILLCAADDHNTGSNAWQAAQHIVRHYRLALPPAPVAFWPPLPASPAAEPAARAGGGDGRDSTPGGSAPEGATLPTIVLRVAFIQRGGRGIRQVRSIFLLQGPAALGGGARGTVDLLESQPEHPTKAQAFQGATGRNMRLVGTE